MVKKNCEIYKCSVCGNIVEVLFVGGGTLVCCGKKMQLLEEKTNDIGQEKHVPVIEKTKNGILVKIGSIPHPMEDSHYIQWIEIISKNNIYRKHFIPGDKPEAEFCVKESNIIVREYCNIHGLWKK